MDRRIEAAILASEVSNLESLEGYFLTPGYTLKPTFPYVRPEPHSRAFLATDRCDPAFVKVGEDEAQEADQAVQVQKPISSVRPRNGRNNHEDAGDTLPFDRG